MHRRLQRAVPALCGALVGMALVAAPVADAAPGELDSGFATGGVFTAPFMTSFPGPEDSHSVAIDSQGRVYLSATQEPQLNGGPLRQVNVVRLSPQGVLDTGFGVGGTATLPTTGDVRNAGIVVDAQDRPIVLTNNGENAATWRVGLTRLTTGGIPDTSFDGDGVVTSALPNTLWNPWPAGVALDSSGGILVVGTLIACSGSCTRLSGFVARFGDGGAIDTAYGTGGWTTVGNSGTEMAAIHALPTGGAVVAGYDDYAEWLVGRLTPGGSPDAAFDGDGEARSSIGKQPLDLVSSYGMTVDGQGRPVVVGQYTAGGNASLAVARWTSAGAPDSTFGTGTPAVGAKLFVAGARGVDAATQCSDGKLLIAAFGSRPDLSGNRMLLLRLDDGGGLDTTFAAASGTPGIGSMTAGQNNTTSDLALTTAGAYVAGFRRQNDDMVFTDYPQVARFAANEACGTGEPPPVTPPVTLPVTPPVTPPAAPIVPTPAAAALPVFSKLVTLPSARKCVSRRKFSIRLRVPTGSNVVEAIVSVNGKRTAIRRGARLRSTVDLRSLPKGRFRVEVVLKLADGRKVRDTRRYRTCAPTKRR